MKYDVFISYSRKDIATANQICDAFEREGISYFIDRQGIGGGMEFPAVLAEAIEESQVFLFLASENSYQSKYTYNEITFAFNEKEHNTLLPYVIDGSRMPASLRFTFASINVRDMREHPIDNVLVEDVLRLLGRERKAEVATEPTYHMYRGKEAANDERLKDEVNWHNAATYSHLHIDCPVCHDRGVGTERTFWKHADNNCNGDIFVSDLATYKCKKCGAESHVRNWAYNCPTHSNSPDDYVKASSPGVAQSITNAGGMSMHVGNGWIARILHHL